MAKDILGKWGLKNASILELREKYIELVDKYNESVSEIERINKAIIAKQDEIEALHQKEKENRKLKRQQTKERIRKLHNSAWRQHRKIIKKKVKCAKLKVISRTVGKIKQAKAEAFGKIRHYQKALTRSKKRKSYIAGVKAANARNKQKAARNRKRYRFPAGFKAGLKEQKRRFERKRLSKVKRITSVDAAVRSGILVGNLSKSLGLQPDKLALFLLIGEHDSFTFPDLKSTFEEMGDQLFYSKISFMKSNNFILRIGTFKRAAIYTLTPFGREVYKRARTYIGRNFRKVN